MYTTGAHGQWQTSYGFTVIPAGDEDFYLDQQDEKFVVSQKADREDLDFATGVFFTWMPRTKVLNNLNVGPTAGLGFDLHNPVVFAGVSATWNQNLSLVLGAVAHEERRLAGQYEVGDELTENLESDQLHATT